LIHALLTFRSVALARSSPALIASSKLALDVELISVTRATGIGVPPFVDCAKPE
jgi:hypothetical protein